MTSLTVLDRQIMRCHQCGSWAWSKHLCNHCAEHGYPMIDDMEVAA